MKGWSRSRTNPIARCFGDAYNVGMGFTVAIAGTGIAAFAIFGVWGLVAWFGLWVAFFGFAMAVER